MAPICFDSAGKPGLSAASAGNSRDNMTDRVESGVGSAARVRAGGVEHDIILHQYPISPYSAKVRIALGIKQLAWRACTPPVIAPKPDFVALTGGYRRVPVMQIGADIYCDSQLIIRTLDRLFPDPPLHTAGADALTFALAPWFERLLTETAAPLAFRDAPSVDPEFARDRELVMERPFVDLAAWRAAAPHAADGLRAQLDWIDAQLSDGRAWLGGDEPGLMDVFAYPNLGFLRDMGADTVLIDRLPAVRAWERRVAALGEANTGGIEAGEAIAIARAATPVPYSGVSQGEPNGLRAGDRVVIRADDYGRDPVAGELVCASAQHVTIRRTDPRAGEVAVHFPRYGFRIERSD
jgi:glutathione S-transferase